MTFKQYMLQQIMKKIIQKYLLITPVSCKTECLMMFPLFQTV